MTEVTAAEILQQLIESKILQIDFDHDLIYVRVDLNDRPVARSVPLNDTVILDVDSTGKLVGVELLGLGKLEDK